MSSANGMAGPEFNNLANKAAVVLMNGRGFIDTAYGRKTVAGITDLIHREACAPLLLRIMALEAGLREAYK